ncbi:MAG: GtrA family protein [Oscillospiraceae bacterium]|nr:GtrA family protein [Oscillospiraceae bacterium]
MSKSVSNERNILCDDYSVVGAGQKRSWAAKIDKQLIRQVLLYAVIGGTSALLDFILFTLFYKQFGINEYLANGISIHAGIAMSFILNRKFNFKKNDRILFRSISFYLTGLFGLALSQGILWLGTIMLLPVITVKLISIFIVAAIQFVVNKIITFGK